MIQLYKADIFYCLARQCSGSGKSITSKLRFWQHSIPEGSPPEFPRFSGFVGLFGACGNLGGSRSSKSCGKRNGGIIKPRKKSSMLILGNGD